MSSRSLSGKAALKGCATGAVLVALATSACSKSGSRPVGAVEPPLSTAQRVLRVCADPNNLPFSNQREEGFENRLARMIADDLHARLEYTWWAQRRGFVRETVTAGACDVLAGVPSRFERTLVTRPYYRSSYVFVSRRDRHLRIRSFDDPQLKKLKVGVQLIGDDGQNTPPAHALAARHIISNVVGYMVPGDYRQQNPPARIVDAVAKGDVDVAVVWGPLAGYFATKEDVPLDLTPVEAMASDAMPIAFDISVGVAPRAKDLRDEIDAVLERRRTDVDRLLDQYGIPRPVPVGQIGHLGRAGQDGQVGLSEGTDRQCAGRVGHAS